MKKRRRFTPEFKAQVVPDVLSGAQSPTEACRKHALSPTLPATWKAGRSADAGMQHHSRSMNWRSLATAWVSP
jgi:transposase-like protein